MSIIIFENTEQTKEEKELEVLTNTMTHRYYRQRELHLPQFLNTMYQSTDTRISVLIKITFTSRL